MRIDFFTELMNRSVFGGGFWLLLLIVSVLWITLYFKNRKKQVLTAFLKENQGVVSIGFVTLGYFLVVAKTALLNAEEANRYELPVYGFCMLLMIAAIYFPMKSLMKPIWDKTDSQTAVKKKQKLVWGIGSALAGMVLLFQITALVKGEVQFLYKEDAKNVQWAAGQKDSAVVFLYNPNNVWMIWDESEELMQYEKIYFVSMADDSAITDKILLEEPQVYVYASRMEPAETIIDALIQDNPNLNAKEKIRELLYFDLYQLN